MKIRDIGLLLCLVATLPVFAQPESKNVHGIFANYSLLLLPRDRKDTVGNAAKSAYRQQFTDTVLSHLDWLLDSANYAILAKAGLIKIKREGSVNQQEEILQRQKKILHLPYLSNDTGAAPAASPKMSQNMQIYFMGATDGTAIADTLGNTNIMRGTFLDIRIHFAKTFSFDTAEVPNISIPNKHQQVAGAAVQIILAPADSQHQEGGDIQLFNKLVLMRGAFSFNEFLPTPNKPTILTGVKIEIGPEFLPGSRAAAVGFNNNGNRDTFYVSSQRLPNLLRSFVHTAASVNGEKPADKREVIQESKNQEGFIRYYRPGNKPI